MISIEKILIYEKYNGDKDLFARNGKKSEKEILKPNDFELIDNILQDIFLLKNNLVSESYNNSIISKINLNFEKETLPKLWELIKKST